MSSTMRPRPRSLSATEAIGDGSGYPPVWSSGNQMIVRLARLPDFSASLKSCSQMSTRYWSGTPRLNSGYLWLLILFSDGTSEYQLYLSSGTSSGALLLPCRTFESSYHSFQEGNGDGPPRKASNSP